MKTDLVTVRFTIPPSNAESAAAFARRLGLLRADLKKSALVVVRPHLRRWPRTADDRHLSLKTRVFHASRVSTGSRPSLLS